MSSKQRKGRSSSRKWTPEEVEYVIGEIEFLKGTDTPESLARRLGCPTASAMARMLQRNGRPDLAVHFERQWEPSMGQSRPWPVARSASARQKLWSLQEGGRQAAWSFYTRTWRPDRWGMTAL